MMFRYSLARARRRRSHRGGRAAGARRRAIRTGDIARPGEKVVGTRAMGDAVLAALRQR
jgi:3-isopropylmalate dehydrogenase